MDEGDKGTAKAMSSAYKIAMLQAFCIPVPGNDDADARSIRLRVTSSLGAPVEGWDQWSHGIIDILRICESIEAVDRLQSSKRLQLKDISRERPDLYAHLGEQFADRRRTLVLLSSSPQAKRSNTKAKRKRDRPFITWFTSTRWAYRRRHWKPRWATTTSCARGGEAICNGRRNCLLNASLKSR